MDRDLAMLLVALAVSFANAWLAIARAQSPVRERPERAPRRVRRAPLEVSGAAPPPAEAATMTMPVATDPIQRPAHGLHVKGGSQRARIFTGESAVATPAPPASKRALKLVAGITALAAAGAVGLLALVGAMVKLFKG
jgi:hypothetical protein